MSTTASDAPPVVVGVDGSDAALGATRWAAQYAAASTSPLVLLHAIPRLTWHFTKSPAPDTAELDGQRAADGDAVLDAAVAALDTDVPVTRKLVKHAVSGALGDASAEARMLVLGSAGSDSGVGSHVIRAINEAHCPTLVWRASAAKRTGKPLPVVVGVDESDHSGRALRAAFDAAAALKAPLTVIHMWELAAAVGLGYSQGLMDWKLLHLMQAEQQEQLDALIAPLAREFPHVHVQKEFQDISPAKGLRELSKSAQLVVVGRRGHGPLTGPILGSVSQNVLHHAECPVLVAP